MNPTSSPAPTPPEKRQGTGEAGSPAVSRLTAGGPATSLGHLFEHLAHTGGAVGFRFTAADYELEPEA